MTTTQQLPEITEDALVFPVIMLDDCVHSDDRPFCEDETCPCHNDIETFNRLIEQPIRHGLMAPAEGQQLFWGDTL